MFAKARIAVIWLLSAALLAVFAPIPLAEAHGGGGGGGGGHGGGGFGGGGFHGGGGGFGGFHGGGRFWRLPRWRRRIQHFPWWTPMGNFHGNTAFHSGNLGSTWHGGTPYIASRTVPNQFHGQSFAGRGGNWNAGRFDHGVWDRGGDFWRHGRDFDDRGFGLGGRSRADQFS